MLINKMLSSTLIPSTKSNTSNTIPVLNFFPNCDYQILKRTSARRVMPLNSGQVDARLQQRTFEKIKSLLQSKAEALTADAIILVERDTEKKKHSQAVLSYTALLIKQKQLSLGKVTIKHELNISLAKNKQRDMPVLTNNIVSSDTGVYGLNLATKSSEVINKWGTPAARLKLAQDTELWMDALTS